VGCERRAFAVSRGDGDCDTVPAADRHLVAIISDFPAARRGIIIAIPRRSRKEQCRR
jgi:hypothetical protein